MNYYNQIKRTLVGNEAYQRVKDYSKNRHLLRAYYEVGKLLVEAQGGEKRAKYGEKLIKKYSIKLTQELGNKYNYRNLMHMRQFFLLIQKRIVNTACSQLTWSHYRILLPLKSAGKTNYYIWLCQQRNLSVRQLRDCIKNKEYERLPKQTKEKFTKQQKLLKKESSDEQLPSKILPKNLLPNENSLTLIAV